MKEFIVNVKEVPDISGCYVMLESNRELIRCKDCKHGKQYEPGCVACEYRELATDPYYFCADGERKE